MKKSLNVHLLAEYADLHDIAGHTAIVIDVLRASTTIVAAIASGARGLVPCLEVDEARAMCRQRPGSLLGGERDGKPIKGFDLGNSPAEYTQSRVNGQTIVFTTTNGTRAMMRCVGCHRVYVGSLVNRQAICRVVGQHERIDLLCAGTDGQVSLEDVLAAGAISHYLAEHDGNWQLNDAAELSRSAWKNLEMSSAFDKLSSAGETNPATNILQSALEQSHGGRNLMRLERREDIRFSSQLDHFDVVPELQLSDWTIRKASNDA